jgi:hypothetical protein
VTLPSMIHELKLSAPLSTTPGTTLNGQRVLGIKGMQRLDPGHKATAILYARASGSPLPVQVTARLGTTAHFTITLTNWNQPIRVATPKGAVPIAKTGLER